MLDPFSGRLPALPLLAAHTAEKPSGGGRVYAVALRLVRPGGEVESFASTVRHAAFGERERLRSGLAREQVAGAPGREEVRSALAARLAGAPVVFALSPFDALGELGELCGGARVVDLAFAAELLWPWVPAATWKGLWEHLEGRKWPRVGFPVEEGAELAVRLLRELCGARLDDTRDPRAAALRFQLAESGTLFGEALRQVNERFAEFFGGLLAPKALPDDPSWERHLETAAPASREEAAGEGGAGAFRPVDPAEVRRRFAVLAQRVRGFRMREQQLRYADLVAAAFNDGAVQVIEAGTGTGKTFGYLLPALELLHRNPALKVAVSTYTKNLQEQIAGREVARLRELFPVYRDLRVAVLKGSSSCVCAEKLADTLEEGLAGAERLAWLSLLVLLYDHRRVEVGTVGPRVRRHLDAGGFLSRLREEVAAGTGCLPDHRRCPAQISQQEARAAHLVVTNHHKLAHLDGAQAFAGLFTRCVVDEANHFEAALRSAYATEAVSRHIARSLEYVERQLARHRRLGREEAFRKAGAALVETRQEMARLAGALRAQAPEGGGGEERWLEAAHPAFDDGAVANNLVELRAGLKAFAAAARDAMNGVAEAGRLRPRTRRRLQTALDALEQDVDDLGLCDEKRVGANRYLTFRLWQRHWELASSPIDVGPIVRESFLPGKEGVVFTSATIAYRRSLGLFLRTLGLAGAADEGEEAPACRAAVIPSPFAREHRMVVVPAGAPPGGYEGKEAWLAYLLRTLPGLVRANRGRTLVLFASHEDLRAAADALDDELAAAGFPLLAQRRGVPTAQLAEEFRAVREAVLFGTETFWYGVDFPGETLTQVVVTRIPYPNQREPLQRGRSRVFTKGEFWERLSYDTAVKLLQGAGRLIRHDADWGKVVVLDARFAEFVRRTGLPLPVDSDDPFVEVARPAAG